MRNQYAWTKRAAALLLVFSLVMALGCSSKPSRSVATKEIDHFLEFFDMALILDIGKIQKCNESPRDPTSNINYPIAEKLGYLEVRAEGDRSWQVDLTDAGRSYLGSRKETPYAHKVDSCGDRSQVDFLVAERKVSDISDIAPDQDGQVLVSYKWKWVLTGIGQRLSPSGDIYQQLSSDQRHALLHDFWFYFGSLEPRDLSDSAEHDDKILLKRTDKGWTVRIK